MIFLIPGKFLVVSSLIGMPLKRLPDDLGWVNLNDVASSMCFEPEMAILVAEALIKVAKTIQEKSKK